MAVVTSDFLAALVTNYKIIFKKSLGENASMSDSWKKVSTIMPSDTDKESLNWLGATPPMSEWKDTRRLRGLRDFDYTLTNRHWENTIPISRDAYRDNKYKHIPIRIKGLAKSCLRNHTKELFSWLDDGETNVAYDGTAMFADTRTIGDSSNIDNLIAMACSGSAAEIRAAVAAAQEKMRLFQDDWGYPLNMQPDTIVCAPEMEIAIKDALLPGVAGTVRPELAFVKDIIVTPWIDLDATDWYMLCTTEEVNPLIFQLRQSPQFTALDNPNTSDSVFFNNMLYYGVDDRFAVGFGDPRTAIKLKDA